MREPALCVQPYVCQLGTACHAYSLVGCYNDDKAHVCCCCTSGSAQQALQTPQTMLDEVVWCVSDPPQQARLDNLHAAAPFADVQGARYGACTPHPHVYISSPYAPLIPICTPFPRTPFPWFTHPQIQHIPMYNPSPCIIHPDAHPPPCHVADADANADASLLRPLGSWCTLHRQVSKLMWHRVETSVRCLCEGSAACSTQLGALC